MRDAAGAHVGGERRRRRRGVGEGDVDASRLQRERVPGLDRVPEALGLLERLTRAETLVDFLTLPAYERLDD